MIVNVTDRDGKIHALEGIEGWRLMEVIRDYGQNDPALGIKAECGGALACATCHVYVGEEWAGRLSPPSEDEIYMMDGAFEVNENSRLSCQILMTEKLDGLEVALAPGSEP